MKHEIKLFMPKLLYLNLCEEEDIIVAEQDLVHPGAQLLREPLVGLQPARVEAQAQRSPKSPRQQPQVSQILQKYFQKNLRKTKCCLQKNLLSKSEKCATAKLFIEVNILGPSEIIFATLKWLGIRPDNPKYWFLSKLHFPYIRCRKLFEFCKYLSKSATKFETSPWCK